MAVRGISAFFNDLCKWSFMLFEKLHCAQSPNRVKSSVYKLLSVYYFVQELKRCMQYYFSDKTVFFFISFKSFLIILDIFRTHRSNNSTTGIPLKPDNLHCSRIIILVRENTYSFWYTVPETKCVLGILLRFCIQFQGCFKNVRKHLDFLFSSLTSLAHQDQTNVQVHWSSSAYYYFIFSEPPNLILRTYKANSTVFRKN